jgi:hypothetical protein
MLVIWEWPFFISDRKFTTSPSFTSDSKEVEGLELLVEYLSRSAECGGLHLASSGLEESLASLVNCPTESGVCTCRGLEPDDVLLAERKSESGVWGGLEADGVLWADLLSESGVCGGLELDGVLLADLLSEFGVCRGLELDGVLLGDLLSRLGVQPRSR